LVEKRTVVLVTKADLISEGGWFTGEEKVDLVDQVFCRRSPVSCVWEAKCKVRAKCKVLRHGNEI